MALRPLPKFVKTTYAKYVAAEKDANTLYFITDSAQHQIYLGSAPYTTTIIVLGANEDLPAVSSAVAGGIYYKQSDSTAHLFDGTAFRALSVPKAQSISAELSADDGTVPTTFAAKQYADNAAAGASANKLDKITATNGNILTAASNGGAVADSGLIAGGATLAASPLSTTLATEAGVKAYADGAASDAAAPKLDKITGTNGNLLTVANGGSAVADSGKSIGGAALAISDGNASSNVLATEAAVKAYADGIGSAANTYTDNAISALGAVFEFKGTKANMTELNAVTGMEQGDVWHVTVGTNGESAEYVYTGTAWEELGTTLDLSGYATKVSGATSGNLAGLDANGNLVDSGKSVGGAALNITEGSASSTVLATEAAVKAYADGVASAAGDAYLAKISGTNGNILTVANNGSAVADSGIAIGGATLNNAPVSTTIATEAAVKAYADGAASDAAAPKLDKITATNGHILTAADGGSSVADSGLVAGGATFAATPVSTTLATEAGVKAYADGQDANKLDKVSATTGHIVLFDSNGSAVKDEGYSINTGSFAAAPSTSAVVTESAVADYVSSALQEIAWSEL